jgi:hypothetical protein
MKDEYELIYGERKIIRTVTDKYFENIITQTQWQMNEGEQVIDVMYLRGQCI